MRSRKRSRPTSSTAASAALAGGIRPALRIALIISGVGVACFGAIVGLHRVDAWVERLPEVSPPLRLEWVNLPEWLRLPENEHLLAEVVAYTGLTQQDSLADPMLARRVAELLADREVGWVRSVVRVVKSPPDCLLVECEFRRPAAWVRHDGADYLIDDEGVRLPGRYMRTSVSGSGLVDIMGVRSGPPDVGEVWTGGDAHAALSVIRLVEGQAFSHQITGIDVSNYGARERRDRPHIALLTNRAGNRIWWGRAPGEEDATEIAAEQKVALLNTIYQSNGRVEMDRVYMDITTWPDKVVLPATAYPAARTGTIRG